MGGQELEKCHFRRAFPRKACRKIDNCVCLVAFLSSSSSSYNLQRALEPIAKMNLYVCLARMPMKATGFAVGVSRARPELLRRVGLNNVW